MSEKKVLHKWDKDNHCVKCGCSRKRRTYKLLMAITGSKNHYLYETCWAYTPKDGLTTTERPNRITHI